LTDRDSLIKELLLQNYMLVTSCYSISTTYKYIYKILNLLDHKQLFLYYYYLNPTHDLSQLFTNHKSLILKFTSSDISYLYDIISNNSSNLCISDFSSHNSIAIDNKNDISNVFYNFSNKLSIYKNKYFIDKNYNDSDNYSDSDDCIDLDDLI